MQQIRQSYVRAKEIFRQGKNSQYYVLPRARFAVPGGSSIAYEHGLGFSGDTGANIYEYWFTCVSKAMQNIIQDIVGTRMIILYKITTATVQKVPFATREPSSSKVRNGEIGYQRGSFSRTIFVWAFIGPRLEMAYTTTWEASRQCCEAEVINLTQIYPPDDRYNSAMNGISWFHISSDDSGKGQFSNQGD